MNSDVADEDLYELLKGVEFLKPPSVTINCSICSEVSLVRWFTPCRHEICTTCVDKNTDDTGEFICPSHGSVCKTSQLTKKTTVYKNIENLPVRCKNKCRGCYLTLPLNQLKMHEKACPMKNSICSNCGQRQSERKKVLQQQVDDLKMKLCKSYEEAEVLMKENISLRESVTRYTQEVESLKKSMEDLQRSLSEVNKKQEASSEVDKSSRTENDQNRAMEETEGTAQVDKETLLVNLEEGADESEYLKMYDDIQILPMSVCLAETLPVVTKGFNLSEEYRERGFSEADVMPPIWGPETDERLSALTLEDENEYSAVYEDIEAQLDSQERPVIGWLNWTLQPWSEIKNSCMYPEVIYSPPLYSHTFGYKFRMALTVGQSFRVYLQVMKGENDTKLTWPFKGKVNVSVVRGKEPHKKNNLQCTVDAKKAWFSKFFQRPEGEANQEPLLCFSPTLRDIENPKKGFLFADTIIIRAVVVPL